MSPSPSSSLATLRPDLATFEAFDLEADRRGFIAQRVLPVLDVGVQAGSYGKIPLAQLLQHRETARAPGAGYNRAKWTFEPDSFATEEHGAEEVLDDREVNVYANYFSAEQISTQRAYDAVLRNQEIRVAAKIFNPTTFAAHTTAVTNEWDDYQNATPIDDIEAANRLIWAASGMFANALIIDRFVYRNLRNCEQVLERIQSGGAGKSTTPREITLEALADLFDVDEVIVAGGTKNLSAEGQAASLGRIWSTEYAMLARIAKSADMKEPGLGRILHWAGDGSEIGGHVEEYREEKVRGKIIRVRHEVQEKLMYVEAGHLLSNITT